jgi:HEAT repeat protein
MPFLIENIITAVLWLIGFALVLTLTLVLVTIQRRLVRQLYFRELDQARARARREILRLYGRPEITASDLDAALARFRTYASRVRRRALEEALLREAARANFELTRRIVVRLGWVDEWIDTLRSHARPPTGELARVLAKLGDTYRIAGRALQQRRAINFLRRAGAAEKLAAIPTREGLIALLAGTRDPNRDVEEVCIRGLGRLAEPVALEVLIENLARVLEGDSRQSIRTLEMALLQYSLADLPGFRTALEHPNHRVRFFGCDVIRRIGEREAARPGAPAEFAPEIARLFTERLWRDESADVRARAALVVGQMRNTASPEILKTLLVDPFWFVRLHACRAACDRFYLPISSVLAQRITDEHWLVREAAVNSLRRMEGFEQILNLFLATRDRYAAEQIADEVQRSGILTDVLARAADRQSLQWTAAVARRMIGLGKPSLILGHLAEPWPTQVKVLLIRELAFSTSPAVPVALGRCALEDPDPLLRAEAARALDAGRHRAAQPGTISGRRSFPGLSGRISGSRRSGGASGSAISRFLGAGSNLWARSRRGPQSGAASRSHLDAAGSTLEPPGRSGSRASGLLGASGRLSRIFGRSSRASRGSNAGRSGSGPRSDESQG